VSRRRLATSGFVRFPAAGSSLGLEDLCAYGSGSLELSGAFTATVNADMRVGTVEETITVSGETPIVDIQSTTRQQVLDHAVIDTVPTGRLLQNI